MSADPPGFRLVMLARFGRDELPTVYDNANAAAAKAEGILYAMRTRPARCPYRIDVIDVWTGETVTSVAAFKDQSGPADTPRVCAACGHPLDPFDQPAVVSATPAAAGAPGSGETGDSQTPVSCQGRPDPGPFD